MGTAWYRRTVEVPADWKNRRVVLYLERPHIETELWVNGKKVGGDNSLCVPHCYDVTDYVESGENALALRVSNRIDGVCVGADSHSVTDQTQGNWNGVVGRMELRSTPLLYAEDIQVYPNIHDRTATVWIRLKQHRGKGRPDAEVKLSAKSFNTDVVHEIPVVSRRVKLKKGQAEVEVVLDMGEKMQLWDEFNPALYELTAEVSFEHVTDKQTRTFGMREFKIDGKMFYVNGRLTQLRGTVENCDFPLTGYAPMDEESWERVFRICRSYGLNHMRFHSFCPPEAAFAAARPCGILFAARRTELAEPRGEAGERNVHRPLFDGRNTAHEQGVWQLCFVLHDGLRQRTGGQLGGLGERFRGLLEEERTVVMYTPARRSEAVGLGSLRACTM